MSVPAERDWLGGAIAACGGGALVVGALLPWMSMFAGLQSYPGVAGLYGRLLLVGGIAGIIAGFVMVARPRRRLRTAIGALGVALAAFASWIVIGLRTTLGTLGHHPLLLARPGYGLFVALAGALVLSSLILAPRART